MDIQIELFNKTIKPILLYGAEIWGLWKFRCNWRSTVKFFKYILKMKRSTPNYMVYDETGVTSISIDIEETIVNFWTIISINNNNNI